MSARRRLQTEVLESIFNQPPDAWPLALDFDLRRVTLLYDVRRRLHARNPAVYRSPDASPPLGNRTTTLAAMTATTEPTAEHSWIGRGTIPVDAADAEQILTANRVALAEDVTVDIQVVTCSVCTGLYQDVAERPCSGPLDPDVVARMSRLSDMAQAPLTNGHLQECHHQIGPDSHDLDQVSCVDVMNGATYLRVNNQPLDPALSDHLDAQADAHRADPSTSVHGRGLPQRREDGQ